MIMSHVGRYYKLAPRRDLCLNVPNNNRSWPEAFKLQIALLKVIPPNTYPAFTVQLAPMHTDPWETWMEWRTEAFEVYGATITARVKLHTLIPTVRAGWLRCELWTDHLVGANQNNDISVVRCDLFNYAGSFGALTMGEADTSFWGTTDMRWEWWTTGAPWTEWP